MTHPTRTSTATPLRGAGHVPDVGQKRDGVSLEAGSSAEGPHVGTAGAAALAVGGAAAAALALLTGTLGYLGSLPWMVAPGADLQQEPNQYLPLSVAWATAAAVGLVGAALSRRRPTAAVALVLVALVIGFGGPPLLTPAVDRPHAVLIGLLAWLVPAAALVLGLVAVAPRLHPGSHA